MLLKEDEEPGLLKDIAVSRGSSSSGRGFGAVPSMLAAVSVLTVHRAAVLSSFMEDQDGKHQEQMWHLGAWDSGGLGSAG